MSVSGVSQNQVISFLCGYLGDLVESDHGVFPNGDESCLRHRGRADHSIKADYVTSFTKMVK